MAGPHNMPFRACPSVMCPHTLICTPLYTPVPEIAAHPIPGAPSMPEQHTGGKALELSLSSA